MFITRDRLLLVSESRVALSQVEPGLVIVGRNCNALLEARDRLTMLAEKCVAPSPVEPCDRVFGIQCHRP